LWKRLYGDSSVSALSLFAVGTGTATPAVTDTELDTVLVGGFTGAATYKAFVSGYPLYDLPNKKVTVRGYVTSAECNGNNLSEAGEFNSDGTKLMSSRDVFTAISKSSTDELAIVWVHKLVNV
jgi:hypothetical protein